MGATKFLHFLFIELATLPQMVHLIINLLGIESCKLLP